LLSLLAGDYAEFVVRFQVWSIEDGLAETKWDGCAGQTLRLGGTIQLSGGQQVPAALSAFRLVCKHSVRAL
jgi:enolase